MGLFWAPPMNEQNTWHRELLSGSTGTQMSPSERFPLTATSNVPLPGYQGGTVGGDYSLCPGSTVLDGEVQSAYARSTMPLGKVHPWIEGDDRAVCFLLRWYHLGWCDPTGGVLWRSDQDIHSWGVPPAFTYVPAEEVAVEKVTPIGGPLRNQLHPSAAWGADKGQGFPKSVPWLEESAAPLLASYCCWTSLTGPQQVKAETPQPEFWVKESLMQNGRRVLASQAGRVRFRITTWVSRTNARSHSAPRLQGSDGLPAKGPITFDCLWGAPGAHATRSDSRTHNGYSVH